MPQRETDDKFRVLAEESPNIIFINKGGRVVYANKMAVELMGYSRREFYARGFDFMRLVAPEFHEQTRRFFGMHARGQEVPPYEYVIVTKGGRRIEAIISTRLVDYEGGRAILGIVTDISRLKRVEAELWQAQKLASLGRLSAGLAHEINNPLSALSGEIQMLLEEARDPKLAASLRFMGKVSLRIENIVRGLLEFARNDPGGDREPLRVREPLERILKLMERRLALCGVRVVRRYGRSLPLMSANRGQLEQVFMNVLINACDAMPEGGVLTVGARRDSRGFLEVSIEDTGAGIPPGDRDRIFDPFFTTKPVGKGTGLGLSISHGIVTRHGGRIRIASGRGRGTKVLIRFPVGRRSNGDAED